MAVGTCAATGSAFNIRTPADPHVRLVTLPPVSRAPPRGSHYCPGPARGQTRLAAPCPAPRLLPGAEPDPGPVGVGPQSPLGTPARQPKPARSTCRPGSGSVSMRPWSRTWPTRPCHKGQRRAGSPSGPGASCRLVVCQQRCCHRPGRRACCAA